MDPILQSLATSGPLAIVLALAVVTLWRTNVAKEERHATEEERLRVAHTAEITTMRAEHAAERLAENTRHATEESDMRKEYVLMVRKLDKALRGEPHGE